MSRRLVRWFAFAGLALLAWLFVWPSFLGGQATYLVVSGSSMEPGYRTGDLVVVREHPAYEIGDIAAYATDHGTVIHRIVDGDGTSGFVLKGDNKEQVDPWMPTEDQIVGSPWLHVPRVGGWLMTVRQVILTPPFPYAAATAVFLAVVLRGDTGRTRPVRLRASREASDHKWRTPAVG
jgi:signal peptidase I